MPVGSGDHFATHICRASGSRSGPRLVGRSELFSQLRTFAWIQSSTAARNSSAQSLSMLGSFPKGLPEMSRRGSAVVLAPLLFSSLPEEKETPWDGVIHMAIGPHAHIVQQAVPPETPSPSPFAAHPSGTAPANRT
eukprot:scaffold2751_cov266-Pinguiococcus_pyrenoidosus.AAC.6